MTSYQCFVVTLGLDGTVVKLRAVKVSRTVIGLPTAKNKKKNNAKKYPVNHVGYGDAAGSNIRWYAFNYWYR